MTFSLSQLFENIGWLGRVDAEHKSRSDHDLASMALDYSLEAKKTLTGIKASLDYLYSAKFDIAVLKGETERLQKAHRKLREEFDHFRDELSYVIASQNMELGNRTTALWDAINALDRRLDVRVAEIGAMERKITTLDNKAEAQKHALSRVAADAADASKAAVRNLFEDLDAEPSVISAALANAERFTEVIAGTINRN